MGGSCVIFCVRYPAHPEKYVMVVVYETNIKGGITVSRALGWKRKQTNDSSPSTSTRSVVADPLQGIISRRCQFFWGTFDNQNYSPYIIHAQPLDPVLLFVTYFHQIYILDTAHLTLNNCQ